MPRGHHTCRVPGLCCPFGWLFNMVPRHGCCRVYDIVSGRQAWLDKMTEYFPKERQVSAGSRRHRGFAAAVPCGWGPLACTVAQHEEISKIRLPAPTLPGFTARLDAVTGVVGWSRTLGIMLDTVGIQWMMVCLHIHSCRQSARQGWLLTSAVCTTCAGAGQVCQAG